MDTEENQQLPDVVEKLLEGAESDEPLELGMGQKALESPAAGAASDEPPLALETPLATDLLARQLLIHPGEAPRSSLDRNRLLWVLLAGVLLASVAAIVFAVTLMRNRARIKSPADLQKKLEAIEIPEDSVIGPRVVPGQKSESDKVADKSAASSKPRRRSRRDRRDGEATGADATKTASDGSGKCMDELSCGLSSNPPPCCARYKKKSSDQLLGLSDKKSKSDDDPLLGAIAGDSNLPMRLGREDIAAGMDDIRSSVAACGRGGTAKGEVKVSVKVGRNGKVNQVRVRSATTEDLGKCVTQKVRRARFAKTQKGGTFSYPFVFR